MSKFLTIRQAVKEPDCPLREGTLRRMVKQREVPGFYAGTRFWVNYEALLQVLAERSFANVAPGAAESLKN